MKYLLLALLSTSAFSATTGTLVLTGIIPKKTEIVVTPKPTASTLDLETTATNLSVATLTGKSNVNAGYSISVSSLNNSFLVHIANSLEKVAYVLKIDTVTPASSIGYTGRGTYTKDVTVSYTGVDGFTKQDGSYSDTVTFTITAN